jgi:hypothetical protein
MASPPPFGEGALWPFFFGLNQRDPKNSKDYNIDLRKVVMNPPY